MIGGEPTGNAMTFTEWQRTPPVTANFGLILVVLVLNGIVVHRNTVALQETQKSVIQSHDAIAQIDQILGRIVEVVRISDEHQVLLAESILLTRGIDEVR